MMVALSALVSAQNPSRASLFRSAGVVMFDKPIPVADYDFSLSLLAGTDQRLSALKGKVVFLNFWATWCPPCRAEMPSMETLYNRYRSKNFTLLAVDLGEGKADVQKFVNNLKLTFPVALDSNEKVSSLYGIEAIPTSYLINKDGAIVGGVQGSIRWDTPSVYALFDYLINE